jgi:hypothetical protein
MKAAAGRTLDGPHLTDLLVRDLDKNIAAAAPIPDGTMKEIVAKLIATAWAAKGIAPRRPIMNPAAWNAQTSKPNWNPNVKPSFTIRRSGAAANAPAQPGQ